MTGEAAIRIHEDSIIKESIYVKTCPEHRCAS